MGRRPHDPMSVRRHLGLFLAIALLEGGYLSLFRSGRLADDVPGYIAHAFYLSIVYLVCCWAVTRPRAGRFDEKAVLRWIWTGAVLFRLTLLPLHPSLSEDTARYRWQGVMQAHGGDPYLHAPQEERWKSIRDETWPRVGRKDLASPYGPMYEQIYLHYYRLIRMFGTAAETEVRLFKLPFALADVGVGLALMGLLAAAGRPRTWALIYLWSPLTVVEFWAEGHNDSVTLFFVVSALTLLLRERRAWAFAALTAAALGKIWPVILFPFWALDRDAGGRLRFHWRSLSACLPVAAILCAPYRQSLTNLEAVLTGLIGGWRNNDSLFAYIYAYAGYDFAAAAALVKKLLAAALGAVWLLQLRLRLCPTQTALAAATILLLLSANCFPWYLTWLLPFLAVHPCASLLLWTAVAPLAHHVVTGYEIASVWQYDRSILALEYAPVFAWLAVDAARRLRQAWADGGVAKRVR